MDLFQSILMGLLQGITEFLPISSSGHLALAQQLLKIDDPGVVLEVSLHLGTLLSVMLVFRKDIVEIFRNLFRRKQVMPMPAGNLGLMLLIGTIPAGIVGILFEDALEKAFSSMLFVGSALIVTGSLLLIGHRLQGERPVSEISWKDALFIGTWQALALIPGISRSGSTIVGGLIRGLDAQQAARFSLLLSLPAIAGAAVLQIPKIGSFGIPFEILGLGVFIAFISGVAAINLLLYLSKTKRLNIFAFYCLLVGAGVVLLNVAR